MSIQQNGYHCNECKADFEEPQEYYAGQLTCPDCGSTAFDAIEPAPTQPDRFDGLAEVVSQIEALPGYENYSIGRIVSNTTIRPFCTAFVTTSEAAEVEHAPNEVDALRACLAKVRGILYPAPVECSGEREEIENMPGAER